jgi:hypothetical protein
MRLSGDDPCEMGIAVRLAMGVTLLALAGCTNDDAGTPTTDAYRTATDASVHAEPVCADTGSAPRVATMQPRGSCLEIRSDMWDAGMCGRAANAYAQPATPTVIGTFYSGCASIEINLEGKMCTLSTSTSPPKRYPCAKLGWAKPTGP